MNYYNPFLAAWLAPEGTGEGLAVQSNQLVAAFNGLLGSIYRFFRMPVADVAAAFHSDDFTTLVSVPVFGEIPLNVALICGRTHMCTATDIHANFDGYNVIKDAFLAVLP